MKLILRHSLEANCNRCSNRSPLSLIRDSESHSPVSRRAEAESEGADDDGEGGEEAEAAEHQVDGERQEQVHLGTVGVLQRNAISCVTPDKIKEKISPNFGISGVICCNFRGLLMGLPQ